MMMMTTSLERGPKAPEKEKFSVGMPSVRPIPPNADTSSKTNDDMSDNGQQLTDTTTDRYEKR